MFLESSRYYKQKTITVTTRDKRTQEAVKLRKLPVVKGKPYTVKDSDRLDVLANQKYKQPAKFWHIADANTELEAQKLLEKSGSTFSLPEE